jgi:hypothetical protein
LIAVCAVAFALLRTPFGFIVVAFGFVIPGFIIERARGGDGVVGGALSASLFAGGLVVAGSAVYLSTGPDLGRALVSAFSLLLAVSTIAFVSGMILSSILYAILKLIGTLIVSPLHDESVGSIHWLPLDDPPVQHR